MQDGADVYLLGGVKEPLAPPGTSRPSIKYPSCRTAVSAFSTDALLLREHYLFNGTVAGSHLLVFGGTAMQGDPSAIVERATLIHDTTLPQVLSATINQERSAPPPARSGSPFRPAMTPPVAAVRLSNDEGVTWSAWKPYSTNVTWTLTSGDGPKAVQVQVRDLSQNVSAAAIARVTLDSVAGTDAGFTINQGALFTNATAVTLRIAAAPYTTQMQVSNDGGSRALSGNRISRPGPGPSPSMASRYCRGLSICAIRTCRVRFRRSCKTTSSSTRFRRPARCR